MTSPDDFPRKPSAYTPVDHFIQRKKDRKIPGSAIAACIERGRVVSHDGENRIELSAKWGTTTYFVVLENSSDGLLAVSCGIKGCEGKATRAKKSEARVQ